jgi:hypothetical protein
MHHVISPEWSAILTLSVPRCETPNGSAKIARTASCSRPSENCKPVLSTAAISALDDLPEKWKHYTEINASYVQGGKFTREEYAKHKAAK